MLKKHFDRCKKINYLCKKNTLMQKELIIVMGSFGVGYLLDHVQKVKEIKNTDCETLKQKYEKSPRIYEYLLAFFFIVILFVSLFFN